nr:retrovirus-related Pol polyprotein from transposon TNT 1-94 [Tanacetum cinerariifolium]
MNPWGGNAAGYGEAQNRVGNVNQGQARPGQARTVKCYNCNGTGHIAQNCTQPKRPQNSKYFKDKMLLMHAQENGAALDAEQLLFLVGGPDNAFDDDVDEQPIHDLALNVDNVFQAKDCDAFDSDVDEAPTAQTMFMANLSSANPITDGAGPSYDSDILFEYVKDIDVSVVHNNASSVPNDTFMMMYDNMCESIAPSVSNLSLNAVVKNSLSAELATYREQVELYERRAKFELTKCEQMINEQLRLSEVRDHDQYLDDTCAYQEEHVMHDIVQLDHVVDLHADHTSISNMIPYDQYAKDIDVSVVHNNASSVSNDTFMMIYDDMCESIAPSVSNSSRNAVVKNSLTAELATYREQVEL